MKKVIVFLFLMFFSCANAKDYGSYCATELPSKTFGGVMMSSIGLNSLSRNIAQNQIEKAIKKETGAKFNVKMHNFYGINFFEGKFKSISAKSKYYAHDGIYLSSINIETICPYNHISLANNQLYFKENMVLKFNTILTPEDYKNTIASQKIDYNIKKILLKIHKYDSILPIITKFKPISLAINIDEINTGKLIIEKIKMLEKNIMLEGYIIIKKNRV